MKEISYKIGNRSFVLDEAKAEEALQRKQVINGENCPEFNILPLKYSWAYELYRRMKNNHWEPEEIPMGRDIEQWKSKGVLSDLERWIIRMGIGYFSAAEGIVGDNILHVVRELVTAPELKLVLGRHAHEENIHTDSLLYMISSLGINPHEVKAMFEQMPTIKAKNDFLMRQSRPLRRDLDLTKTENKRAFAKNLFGFFQVMEGTQFYGLFGMVLSLHRQNKMTGIGEMFQYTLRDESNHIELGRHLFQSLIAENSDIMNAEFEQELVEFMKEGVSLEKQFISDCLPQDTVGLNAQQFHAYIDYIADRRLMGVGLPRIGKATENPFPWLSETIDLKKEKNFFETRPTEYQKASSLNWGEEDL
jgi:ribonucleoside-diphosphate reductase beta chain